MKKIIEIINLKKKYGKKVIFDNLNLDIFSGDRVALIGPNGCGKTTLVEIICGLRKIHGGKINYHAGKDTFFQSLGMQFQSGHYPNAIRVTDLIYLYSNVYAKRVDPKLKKKFEIDEIEKKEINDLSFGQRKRMELFLLLFSGLKFLILDEITSGMDIAIKMKTLKILEEYLKENNIGVIYISHNLAEISKICNRMIILTERGIVFDKKIDKNFDVQKEVTKVLQISEKTQD